jgi:hypothetical protein
MSQPSDLTAAQEAELEIKDAWAIEAERRDTELEQGKATALSGEAVLAKLRAL